MRQDDVPAASAQHQAYRFVRDRILSGAYPGGMPDAANRSDLLAYLLTVMK